MTSNTPIQITPTFSAPLPSPCIGLCTMNPANDLCDGCQRTIEEIAGWGSASEERRRSIWQAILQRRADGEA